MGPRYHLGLMMWFDAHLDLAYLAVNGRDMTAPLDVAAGPHPPAAVTLPSLAEGGVRLALATIFTELDGSGPEGYPAGDSDRAYRVGRAQLEAYLTWQERGLLDLDMKRALARDPGVGQIRGGMGVSHVLPSTIREIISRVPPKPPLRIGILIENADPIRSPAELTWWQERGVVAIGMAWAKSSRYAGGNMSDDGVSELGRELVREIDRVGIVHDASHLSDRAFDELCGLTNRPIIASHSNCRAILGDPAAQRHLRDEQIREIARRRGVIGLNLFAKFIDRRCGSILTPNAAPVRPERPTIDAAVDHLDHICQLTGSHEHIGLGSDMDGGFGADRLPMGIDLPRDLYRLADAMSARGWSDDAIFAFACGNWANFWSERSTGSAEIAGAIA